MLRGDYDELWEVLLENEDIRSDLLHKDPQLSRCPVYKYSYSQKIKKLASE